MLKELITHNQKLAAWKMPLSLPFRRNQTLAELWIRYGKNPNDPRWKRALETTEKHWRREGERTLVTQTPNQNRLKKLLYRR